MNVRDYYRRTTATQPPAPSPSSTEARESAHRLAEHGDPSVRQAIAKAPLARSTDGTRWVLPSDVPAMAMRGLAGAADRSFAAQTAAVRTGARMARRTAGAVVEHIGARRGARVVPPPQSSTAPSPSRTEGIDL